jgi:hypothetical protein
MLTTATPAQRLQVIDHNQIPSSKLRGEQPHQLGGFDWFFGNPPIFNGVQP